MYTCFYNHHKTGRPILRPVIFESGKAEDSGIDDQGFLGDHIIYCPIFSKNTRSRSVHLPKGKWFDYESQEKLEGGLTHEIKAPLTKIPFFVREGAVIPTFPVMQYVGEKEVEIVTLKVYYKRGTESSNFYFDRNDGNEYKHGDFRLANFYTEGSLSNFSISQEILGSFKATFAHYRLQIIGLSASELNIEVDGHWLHKYSRLNGIIVEFNVKSDFETIEIRF
jgi:alpha-glucosidase